MSEAPPIPFVRLAPRLDSRPHSLAARIHRGFDEAAKISLLGIPDDTGIHLNDGRVGARLGPAAFRAALMRAGTVLHNPEETAQALEIADVGDVEVASGNDEFTLAETHHRIREIVRMLHTAGQVTIAVGGGHDLTFPCVTGMAEARTGGESVTGLSLDAHFDVRDTVGSGMPFRSLIENHTLAPSRFGIVGASRFANTQAHFAWARAQGIQITWGEDLLDSFAGMEAAYTRCFAADEAIGFVSICLDAIDQAHAPGVSAPNPLGLPPRYAAWLARRAGADPRVRHFDLMELSPPNDLGQATSRLAAHLFLCFVAGFSERGA